MYGLCRFPFVGFVSIQAITHNLLCANKMVFPTHLLGYSHSVVIVKTILWIIVCKTNECNNDVTLFMHQLTIFSVCLQFKTSLFRKMDNKFAGKKQCF